MVKNKNIDNAEAQKFIDGCYKEVDTKSKENETLFSIISGKCSDENSATRILTFFFDPNREHNMNDLFIRSFIEAAGDNYEKDFPKNYDCQKEFYTKHGKRIDILLMNKKCNIVIENKIYADLYNDLNEYYDTAKSRGCGKPKVVKGYVLSLFDLQDEIDEKKQGERFKSVTYTKFIESLENNYCAYKKNTLEKQNIQFCMRILLKICDHWRKKI